MAVALSIVGFGAAPLMSAAHQDHAVTMDQGGASCLTLCLGASRLPYSAPFTPTTALSLLLGVMAVVAIALPMRGQFLLLYLPAHARPSPNYIDLYSHRLD